MNTDLKIFLSYSWADRVTADGIEKNFHEFGIQLVRDAREISYTKSIKAFMKQVRHSDFVLMLISDSYLKSPNCMYEVLEFIKDENFNDRLLPLIVGDYKILAPPKQIEYVKYWAAQYRDFKVQMQGIPPDQSIGQAQHLQILNNISATCGEFLALLSDISAFRVDELNTAIYWDIFKKIGLSSAEILRLCEQELYSCRYTSKLQDINEKRSLLIEQLAEDGEIEEVLNRRFLYTIAESVAKNVDYALGNLLSWKATDFRIKNFQKIIESDQLELEKSITNGDSASAALAAHILIVTCKRSQQKPSDELIEILFNARDSYKHCILAEFLDRFDLKKHTETLASWIKSNIDSVRDPSSAEAWTLLSQVLRRFDRAVYIQLFMLAHYKFLRFNSEKAKPFMYPLLPLHNDIYVTDSDYNRAIESNEKELQLASIWMFSLKGAGITQQAERNYSRIKISQEAEKSLRSLVESGLDTREKWRFCNAIVKANLYVFLDWVEQLLKSRDGIDDIINMNDPNYGAYDEPQAALFFRAYGYLVRMRDENMLGVNNEKERAFLKACWKEAVRKVGKGYRAGVAIGRGYLGEWKPILSILSNEEPWLHEGAVNIVQHWVNEANSLKEVVKYVENRLNDGKESSEAVKAILKKTSEEAKRKLEILEIEEY